MAQCAAEEFSGEFDEITWVPVSRKRLKKRGFDQSENAGGLRVRGLACKAAGDAEKDGGQPCPIRH